MDKTTIEKLTKIATDAEASGLIMMFNAWIEKTKAYRVDNSSANLKEWQAVERALNEKIDALSAKYRVSGGEVRRFENRLAAWRFLRMLGCSVSRSKFYQDVEAGVVAMAGDGTLSEFDVREYANAIQESERMSLSELAASRFIIPSSMPAGVKKRLKDTIDHLTNSDLSEDVDRIAWDRYCHHVHLEHVAYMDIKKNGYSHVDERGIERKRPCVQMQKDHSLAALRFEEQFGLTPVSRNRMPDGKKKPPDEQSQLGLLFDEKDQAGKVVPMKGRG